MTEAVEHQKYQSFVIEQTARVKREVAYKKWNRLFLNSMFMIGTFCIFLIVIILAVTVIQGGKFEIGFVLFAVMGMASMIAAYLIVDPWVLSTFLSKPIHMTCPHCEGDFDLTKTVKCGWCGSGRADSGWNTALDDCPSCKKAPIAATCPCCSNDVVLELDSYNSAPEQGFGYAGTITGLKPL